MLVVNRLQGLRGQSSRAHALQHRFRDARDLGLVPRSTVRPWPWRDLNLQFLTPFERNQQIVEGIRVGSIGKSHGYFLKAEE